MIIKSKVYNVVPAVGINARYKKVDSIVVNKDFLYWFDFEQYHYPEKCSVIMDILKNSIEFSHRNMNLKYQKKVYDTIVRVYEKMKTWNPDDLIVFEEGIRL